MSTHIGAEQGQIADIVLMPGDPLRAKYIAETFFDSPSLYNQVRGMYGYTGTYKGVRVSVQGSGMGVPSFSIYAHELLNDYHCKTLVRVGTCGAMQDYIQVRDVILAMSASTDSAANHALFPHVDYAPTATFELLHRAYNLGQSRNLRVQVGNVFTSDTFYREDVSISKQLANYGVLAVEMETSALYTLAARFKAKALSVLTVSDHLLTGEQTSPAEREQTFRDMMELALDTVTG